MFASYHIERSSLGTGNRVKYLNDFSDEAGITVMQVGHAVRDCEVRICSDEDIVEDEEIVGHIHIRGENVTRQYYRYPAATSSIFTKDGWLRTGDLGFFKGGQLIVTGRLKNSIIYQWAKLLSI